MRVGLLVVAAGAISLAFAVQAHAQRVVPSTLAARHVSAPNVTSPRVSVAPLAGALVARATGRQESDSAAGSNAAGWGALAGTLIGGAYGYAVGGAGCDGAAGTQRRCRTTITAGGAVVGAVLGYGMGHIIGVVHDRNRAR